MERARISVPDFVLYSTTSLAARGRSMSLPTTTTDPWFIYPAPARTAPVRLFCLPYAGGGASIYRSWPARIPDVEMATVELPGRETRLAESPYADMPSLVTALTDAIEPHLTKAYAIFGHSLGARLGFELCREIRRRELPAPLVLFASGCRAPHVPRVPNPPMAALPDRTFIAMLQQISGTPPEVFEDPELLRLLLPALRADFTLVDGYEYTDEPALPWPIRGFGGTDDTDAREDTLLAWQAHTSASFALRRFAGGHFVLRSRPREFAEAVAADLAELLAEAQP
jgi:surfactin synthase thioesterase subunit